MQLFDEGHPSWFVFERGTRYSLENDTYSNVSEEFWDFSWEEYGTKDVKAAVQYISQYHGSMKVAINAYSMGTTMMYGAMAEDYDFFREHLYKVAQIAPCTIVDGGQSLFSRDAVSAVGALSAQGVYAVGGPNWHRDIVKVR